MRCSSCILRLSLFDCSTKKPLKFAGAVSSRSGMTAAAPDRNLLFGGQRLREDESGWRKGCGNCVQSCVSRRLRPLAISGILHGRTKHTMRYGHRLSPYHAQRTCSPEYVVRIELFVRNDTLALRMTSPARFNCGVRRFVCIWLQLRCQDARKIRAVRGRAAVRRFGFLPYMPLPF